MKRLCVNVNRDSLDCIAKKVSECICYFSRLSVGNSEKKGMLSKSRRVCAHSSDF